MEEPGQQPSLPTRTGRSHFNGDRHINQVKWSPGYVKFSLLVRNLWQNPNPSTLLSSPLPLKSKRWQCQKTINRVSCLWCCLWGSTIIGGYLVFGGSSVTPLSFLFGFLLRFLAYLWSSCLWLLHRLWILRLKTVRVLQESSKKQSVNTFYHLLTGWFGDLSTSQRKQVLGISVGTHWCQTEATFNETGAAASLLLLHVPFDEWVSARKQLVTRDAIKSWSI